MFILLIMHMHSHGNQTFKHKIKPLKTTYTIKQDTLEEERHADPNLCL